METGHWECLAPTLFLGCSNTDLAGLPGKKSKMWGANLDGPAVRWYTEQVRK
jgi:hypothetical protein